MALGTFIHRVACPCIGLFVAMGSSAGFAQVAINEPTVDDFGVERKTGRALFSLPEINSIGGDGASRLSIKYTHVDGARLDLSGIPSIRGYEVDPCVEPQDGCHYNTGDPASERYMLVIVSYGAVNERFRKMWNGTSYSGAWLPEYPTGSTFTGEAFGVGEFVSKDGLKISRNSTTNAAQYSVEYPDGVTLKFDLNTDSDGAYVSNNFGYAIKMSVENDGVTFQSLNQARDYCSLYNQFLCANLSFSREGSLGSTKVSRTDSYGNTSQYPTEYIFTNPAGEVARLRNVLLGLQVKPPICATYSSPPGLFNAEKYKSCSGDEYRWFAFPAGYKKMGKSVEDYRVTYDTPEDEFQLKTYEQVRIEEIVHNGVIVDYESVLYKPSSGGYSADSLPSWVYITSRIEGVEQSYSAAYQPPPNWGYSRRWIEEVRDANSRTTYYSANQFMEIASVEYPEGNGSYFVRDDNNNIVETGVRSKLDGQEPRLTTTYQYLSDCAGVPTAKCAKPVRMIDPMGNVTDYTYNNRGQVLTETGPAPAPGEPRPIVRNEYTERAAYIHGPNGTVVAAGPPISLLTRSSRCIMTEGCEGGPDEVITEYDYGPVPASGAEYLTNLTLRGIVVTAANGAGQLETRRTCYQYNYFGEKIAESTPRANLASCQ